jgi:poly-gamma-glutamate capsule biosynthesis protein CapA/YwtB (metallophosphatase superfamily)
MLRKYSRKTYLSSHNKTSVPTPSRLCDPLFFYKSMFFRALKKISILVVLVFTLFGCSIRTQIPPPEVPQEPRPFNQLTIAAIGDIMVHGAQLASAWDEECDTYDFEPVFSTVKDFLSAADLTFGNLETTLPGRKKLYAGYPRFGTPDALVAAIHGAGIDILTTANNHSCDTGKRGVVRTIKVLDKYGILHVGTYRSKSEYEANRILIVERNYIRLAVLSYTYGLNGMPIPKGTHVNLIDEQQMSEDIALAREQCPDFIIVLIHYGKEYERYPDQFQKETVAFLFHEGVDIVLGSHPHVVQPYVLTQVTDKYGDAKPRLVIYSLGNFVSNQRDRYRDGGIIFKFSLQKNYTTDKGTTRNITNVNYAPTWVYIHRTADKNQFYILPIPKYFNNDQPLHLPDDAYQKMMTFYRDTRLHLLLSPIKIRQEMKLPLPKEE